MTSSDPEPHAPTESQLFAGLLPDDVVWRWRGLDEPAPDLHPSEAAHVARAVPKRQHEFAAGRACARAALTALCGYDGPLPAGVDRAPVWPAGVVGSITHNERLCAAAVASARDVASLGIDIDTVARFDPHLEASLCTPGEIRRWLHAQAAAERQRRLALLFCIKEALYKAQYPLTRGWLDFTDVEVTALHAPDEGIGQFEIQLLKAPQARDAARAAVPPGWRPGYSLRGACRTAAGYSSATLVLRPADLPPAL